MQDTTIQEKDNRTDESDNSKYQVLLASEELPVSCEIAWPGCQVHPQNGGIRREQSNTKNRCEKKK